MSLASVYPVVPVGIVPSKVHAALLSLCTYKVHSAVSKEDIDRCTDASLLPRLVVQ